MAKARILEAFLFVLKNVNIALVVSGSQVPRLCLNLSRVSTFRLRKLCRASLEFSKLGLGFLKTPRAMLMFSQVLVECGLKQCDLHVN